MGFKEWWGLKPEWFRGLFIGFIVFVVLTVIELLLPPILLTVISMVLPVKLIIFLIPFVFVIIWWIVGKIRARNATEAYERKLGTSGIIITVFIVILIFSPMFFGASSSYQLRARALQPNEVQAFKAACESQENRAMEHYCNWDNVTIDEVKAALGSCGDLNSEQFKEKYNFCLGNNFEIGQQLHCLTETHRLIYVKFYSSRELIPQQDEPQEFGAGAASWNEQMIKACAAKAVDGEKCYYSLPDCACSKCEIYQDDSPYCNPKLPGYKYTYCQAFSGF
ncbi:MAG: hypothetical protein MUF61_00440 [archaeon]|jgi:hypothetical protein|nr:hypothetical protein [archaeon]